MPPFKPRFSPGRLDTERNRLLLERAAWLGVGLSAAGLALVGYQFLLATALASTPTPLPRPTPLAARSQAGGRPLAERPTLTSWRGHTLRSHVRGHPHRWRGP